MGLIVHEFVSEKCVHILELLFPHFQLRPVVMFTAEETEDRRTKLFQPTRSVTAEGVKRR
jgi:hypothetical protein